MVAEAVDQSLTMCLTDSIREQARSHIGSAEYLETAVNSPLN